jgi:hypothetical protein
MSTLRTNTLSNAAGSASVPVDTVISGSAKAWVNFNGTGTVAIRAQFNVSSITDNGTGDYTVNFTTAMSDANYSVLGTCEIGAGATSQDVYVSSLAAPATNSVRINVGAGAAGAATLYDSIRVNVAIFR